MKVILHVGTHKTGTSSIQNFLTTNSEKLLSQGVYYGLSKESIRNVNDIAAHIAYGRKKEVELFFNEIIEYAKKKETKCLFISAESLYSMTGFFHSLQSNKIDDYWQSETLFISFLSDCLKEVEVEIIMYLRRQDIFLESIYNQFIKQWPGYRGSIDEFYNICPEILDYEQHLSLWTELFPDATLTVKSFEIEKPDLINRLLVNDLNINDKSDFVYPKKAINTRLKPSYLSFKRILNNMDMTLSEAYVVSRIIMKLSQNEINDIEDSGYTLISKALLDDIVNRYANDNDRLVQIFLDGNKNAQLDLRQCAVEKKKIYPRLEISEGIKIYCQYKKLRRTPKAVLEIKIRNFIKRVLISFPVTEHVFYWLRKINNKNRLRLEREGTF